KRVLWRWIRRGSSFRNDVSLSCSRLGGTWFGVKLFLDPFLIRGRLNLVFPCLWKAMEEVELGSPLNLAHCADMVDDLIVLRCGLIENERRHAQRRDVLRLGLDHHNLPEARGNDV